VGSSTANLVIRLASLLRERNRASTATMLQRVVQSTDSHDVRALDAVLKRLEVALGMRRLSVGIYDHALHAIGGGQKYVATTAASLKARFDVTYLVNVNVDLVQVGAWYGLDLSGCRKRVVPLPFYGGRRWIDSSLVTADMNNPFDAVARASADYDVFLNANMLEKVRPLAPLSVLLCHFPDVLPRAHFAAHEYTVVVANGRYTADWIRRRWSIEPSMLLYPPVDARAPHLPKEPFILSVARFELGGSKKQLEMIHAFRALRRALPDVLAGWRLVLAGGSIADNPYLNEVRKILASDSRDIELHVNVPHEVLRSLYARASLFWHACGLHEREPHLIEHFGMTTAEAMQNGCVPVVFDGGGQREIVEHGVSGFRFASVAELCEWTVRLIRDDRLRAAFQAAAQQRSSRFSGDRFERRVASLFDLLAREYSTLPDAI
jgi:O-antigen biosynthesis protein